MTPEREETQMTLHDKLVHAATEYDRKQSSRRGYNRWAFGQYLEAIERVDKSLEFEGVTVRQALVENFCGRLLDVLLKVAEETPSTRKEQMGGLPSLV
jgi:hypothetical protein